MAEIKICPTCEGGGKVDDKKGRPWKTLSRQRNPQIASGELLPVPCKECAGTGRLRSKAEIDATRNPEVQAAAVAAPDMHPIRPPRPPGLPSALPTRDSAETAATGPIDPATATGAGKGKGVK